LSMANLELVILIEIQHKEKELKIAWKTNLLVFSY
jgi:hypothetical protein